MLRQMLAWLSGLGLVGLTFVSVPAQETKLPTVDEVMALKSSYQAERDRLDKTGEAKRFLPILMNKADEIARRAETALTDGRMLQAVEGFRQARWQLPYQAPQVPGEHVARVLGNMRLRHYAAVYATAFSPDGRYLASGSRDSTVKIWDLANGHELRSYAGHGDEVRAVAFSPDGKLLASGGGDADIKVWEVATGKDVRTIAGNGINVKSLIFSPDGRYVLSGQTGKTDKEATKNLLCVNEVETGKLVRSVEDFRLPADTLNFNAVGTLLAVGCGDGQMRLWEYPAMVTDPTRPAFWTQQDPSGAVYHVVISPDNRTLARCGLKGVKLFNLPQPDAKFQVSSPKLTIETDQKTPVLFKCVAFSKDSKTLFTGGADGVIRLFDPESGAAVGTFKGHNGSVTCLMFNPGGNQLASASLDYTIRLWDFDIVLQARDYTGHDAPVWKTSFSPDGQRLVSAGADRLVRVWEVGTGKVLHTLSGHQAPVTSAQFSPSGKLIASAGGDKVVKIWDAATGKHLRDLAGHQGTITTLDFGPLPAKSDENVRLVTGSVDRKLKIWDVDTGKELVDIDNGSVPAAVAFRGDGKQVAAGNIDQTVKLYDAGSGKPQNQWAAHGTAVSGVAYSPDGQCLASCGVDQLVRVWPLSTPGNAPITLTGHNGPLSAVAFRKDSLHLASCGSDMVVKLWKLEGGAGKEMQNYRGHREWVTSVAFSKDGFYLASSGVDRLIKIWEITSREIPLLSEHTGAVQAVAVSPDGKLIASGASDSSIKLWDRSAGVESATLLGHLGGITALVFSADSRTLVSASNDRTLKLWDTTTGKELTKKPRQLESWNGFLKAPPLINLTPDGTTLFVWEGGSERFTKFNVYDLASGNELFTFNDTGRNVLAVSMAASGKAIAAGDAVGNIRLFDLEKKGQMYPGGDWFLFDKETGTGDIALTPDAKHLVVTSDKGDMKICKVEGRATLHAIKAHNGHVNACLISPDGKRIATAGLDNMVKLWDLASGKELRQWNMQGTASQRRGLVLNVAFSPDGKQLITANANTTLFVLDLP